MQLVAPIVYSRLNTRPIKMGRTESNVGGFCELFRWSDFDLVTVVRVPKSWVILRFSIQSIDYGIEPCQNAAR